LHAQGAQAHCQSNLLKELEAVEPDGLLRRLPVEPGWSASLLARYFTAELPPVVVDEPRNGEILRNCAAQSLALLASEKIVVHRHGGCPIVLDRCG
jgi:hypothetical protein